MNCFDILVPLAILNELTEREAAQEGMWRLDPFGLNAHSSKRRLFYDDKTIPVTKGYNENGSVKFLDYPIVKNINDNNEPEYYDENTPGLEDIRIFARKFTGDERPFIVVIPNDTANPDLLSKYAGKTLYIRDRRVELKPNI